MPFFKSKKRKHFEEVIRQTKKKLWNEEFRRERLKALREDVRIEYDRINEKVRMAKTRVEEEKKRGKEADKEAIEKLEKLVEHYSPDLAYKTQQMASLDKETDDETAPESCIALIQGYRAALDMLKAYVKKC